MTGVPAPRFDPKALRRSWDHQQQFHIPDREDRFEVILGVLERVLPPRPRVLDLGCGTGSLSERVLKRFPWARVWAFDYDPVLLRLGREGVGKAGGRLTWVEGDLRRPGWTRALAPGRYDAAVTTTALHWLTRTELSRLFHEMAGILRRGSAFLNGDGMPFDYPPSPAQHPQITRIARSIRAENSLARPPKGVLEWEAWWKNLERVPELARELALRRLRYPRAHEVVPPPSASWQLRELKKAGFREAAVIWQQMTNTVLLGLR